MDKIQVICANAFSTEHENSGNPAGIVWNEKRTEKEMQQIAKQVGLSETVFIETKGELFQFRFFTPVAEVDLCGHATIAAAGFLAKVKHVDFPIKIRTKAGKLELFQRDDSFFMKQPLPIFREKIDASILATSLQINESEIGFSHFQPQIVSTGLPDLLIPISSVSVLQKITPDFDKIAAISTQLDIAGYHLFAVEENAKTTALCRNFAPHLGILEESATGTASGALACYLFQNGLRKKEYILKQGYAMERPSEIKVNLSWQKESITKVLVGGKVEVKKTERIDVNPL